MIFLAIILALAVLLSVGLNLYLHNQGLQYEHLISRLRDNAISEIEYLEAENDQYKETLSKVNYHACADSLESMAKNRHDGKYLILRGQMEGLLEAANFLRKEAKRIGIKK
jgi:hypothetical protein